jgi:Holliday junction resolvase
LNAKRKGNRNEHRSIALLEAAGYACTRAAASLGVFDIVGIGPSDVVLVQTKSNDWPRAVETEAIRNSPAQLFPRSSSIAGDTVSVFPDIRILD